MRHSKSQRGQQSQDQEEVDQDCARPCRRSADRWMKIQKTRPKK